MGPHESRCLALCAILFGGEGSVSSTWGHSWEVSKQRTGLESIWESLQLALHIGPRPHPFSALTVPAWPQLPLTTTLEPPGFLTPSSRALSTLPSERTFQTEMDRLTPWLKARLSVLRPRQSSTYFFNSPDSHGTSSWGLLTVSLSTGRESLWSTAPQAPALGT